MKNRKTIFLAMIAISAASLSFAQINPIWYQTGQTIFSTTDAKLNLDGGGTWMLDVGYDINLYTDYQQYTHGAYRVNDLPVLHTWGGADNLGFPTTTCLSVGLNAGKSNTGYYDTFTGSGAGYSNTTGSNNSFTGYLAGHSNTTANDNSFTGYSTGYSNTTGTRNSFMGSNSGNANTTGNDNSFFGYNAGFSNVTSFNNSFFGSNAGYLNTASYSTGMGCQTLYQSRGAFNSALGAFSGYSNTTGVDNSFIGYRTGYANTSGSYNVFLGSFAGYLYNNGNGNLAIGYNAQLANPGLTNAMAFGYNSTVENSNSIVLGNSYTHMNVGFGTSAPAYTLQLMYDDAAKPGTSTWTIASDARLKKDITPFKDGLDVLNKINPVWFSYNGKAGMPTDKKYVGIIAQDMQKIAPYTIGTYHYQDTTGNKEDYLDYNANAVTYIIINSIKQQQQQIEQKDSVIKDLKNELAAMNDKNQEELNAMKERMNAFENSLSQCCSSAQQNNAAGASIAGTTLDNDIPMLEQNAPNPFNENTIIKYYIPQSAASAAIKVLSMEGTELFSAVVSDRGTGQTQVTGNNLAAGKYIYQLVINGKVVASKIMVLVK